MLDLDWIWAGGPAALMVVISTALPSTGIRPGAAGQRKGAL